MTIARLVADAAHQRLDDRGVIGAIDAGASEADRRGQHGAVADGALHHLVQDLLHLELADRLEVGPGASGL